MNPLATLRSLLRFRPIELRPTARRLRAAASPEDFRQIAKRRLPGGVFDYIDGAAEDERTARANLDAFAAVRYSPQVLRDVSRVETTTTLFGRELAMPLVLAPTGFTRIAAPAGELAVARAAERAGLPYTLSTLSTRSIEEVASVTGAGARNWFQVYVWRDRGLVASMLERAQAAGYEAIMVTVDTAVLGRRERDVRRGFTMPPKVGPGTLLDGILHPAWTLGLVTSEPITFANVVGASVGDGSSAVALSEFAGKQFDQRLSWSDLEWFRDHWSGPMLVKGVQRVDDALRAEAAGVDAVVLSNHGGRQLDGAPPPLELVEPVSQALGGRISLLMDGGVRRGGDVAKAVALGADACMIGRSYLYGLAAAGEAGVDAVLAEFAASLTRTMSLLGATEIAAIGRDLVTTPADRS